MSNERFIIHNCVQGDDTWLRARCGVTSSTGAKCVISLAELFNEKGRDILKGREDYSILKANERITGVPANDGYSTAAMDRGTRVEPEAREAYRATLAPGLALAEVGLLTLADDPWVGDSPDGLVYDDTNRVVGGCEIKAPLGEHHFEYLFEDWRAEQPVRRTTVPREHIRQVLHHLYVTGADWWDFVSYHDEDVAQMHTVRLTAEAAAPLLARYVPALAAFQAEVARIERVKRAWLQAQGLA